MIDRSINHRVGAFRNCGFHISDDRQQRHFTPFEIREKLEQLVSLATVAQHHNRVLRTHNAKAAMQGIGPAVIGVLAVTLARLAPHALPDPFAIAILIGTLIALLGPRVGALRLMFAGGVLGVLRSRLMPLVGARALF